MSEVEEVPLSNGGKAIIDKESLPLIAGRTWRRTTGGYAAARTTRNGKQIYIWMHRIINYTPDGLQTDHINGDRLDNRRGNLRVASNTENGRNRTKRRGSSSSQFKGVSLHNNTTSKIWQAQIRVRGKIKHLGCFDTEEDAAVAYNIASKIYFGSFSKLNDVEQP